MAEAHLRKAKTYLELRGNTLVSRRSWIERHDGGTMDWLAESVKLQNTSPMMSVLENVSSCKGTELSELNSGRRRLKKEWSGREQPETELLFFMNWNRRIT